MNILFVSTKNPYPIADGHSLRTYNLIKQVAARHNIFLLTFIQTKQELAGIEHMRGFCKDVLFVPIPANESLISLYLTGLRSLFSNLPFVVLKYRSPQMRYHITEIFQKEKIDLVHFDLLPLSQYCQYVEAIPTIMVDHNVESILLKRKIKKEKYPKKIFLFVEWLKLRKYEAQSLRKVNLTIAVSENDKDELKKYSPDAKIEVIENGVDTVHYQNDGNSEEESSLVYVGGLNWFPNLDAIKYFCSDILPIIKKEISGVKLRVVGKLPKKAPPIDDELVEFLGFVEDERIIVSKSAVFIVPLRIGGGTRLKILNALSMGKAIVSTSIGCEGLNVENGKHIIVADKPQQFAESVIYLLRNPEKRKAMGKQGRILVTNHYDWRILSKKILKLYKNICC